MRSLLTASFRKNMAELPAHIQDAARFGFEQWKRNPNLVGWKRITGMRADLYSVQIGARYRAIGVWDKTHDAVVWMFVGSHETYNNWINIHRQMSSEHWLRTRDVKQRIEQRRAEPAASPPKPSVPL